MKIGFFSESYLPRKDGVAMSIETFRAQLEALGHQVYVFAPAVKNVEYSDENPRIIRFPAVKSIFINDLQSSVFYPPTAVKKIEKIGLDLIHFHTPSPTGLLGVYVASKNNLPLVTTYHTDMYSYIGHYPAMLPATLALAMVAPIAIRGDWKDFQVAMATFKPELSQETWGERTVRKMSTLVHNHCDLVIAPSVKTKNQLLSWKTTTRIEVLPTGVDEITSNPESINQVRLKYGLKQEDKVIIFVGRLGSEKNLELLIKSLQLIVTKMPSVKLVLVGDHPHREALAKLISELNLTKNVIFTGYAERQQLGSLYKLADVFAFPSLTDTQGLVVHEAALAGLPIVMIDQAITEVVKDGVNGFIAKNSKFDFAKKIMVVLRNKSLEVSMGKAGQKIAGRYTSRKQAEKLLSLYLELIKLKT